MALTMTRSPADPIRFLRHRLLHWPLASGGAVELRNAFFDSVKTLDLTNNGTVTQTAGPSANLPDAANFVTASSQSLSRAASTDFTGLNDFTIRVWGSVPTGATFFFASQDDGAVAFTQRSWGLLYLSTGGTSFRFDYSFDGAAASALDLAGLVPAADTFYHIVVRRRGAFLEISANGLAFRTKVAIAETPLFPSTSQLVVGGRDNGTGTIINQGTGKVAGLVIAKRFWTDEEVFWDYNNGQGRDLIRGV